MLFLWILNSSEKLLYFPIRVAPASYASFDHFKVLLRQLRWILIVDLLKMRVIKVIMSFIRALKVDSNQRNCQYFETLFFVVTMQKSIC